MSNKTTFQLKEEQFCHGRIVNFTSTLDLMLFHGAMLNLLILFVNKRVTSYKRVLWLIIKSTKSNTSGVEGAANSVCSGQKSSQTYKICSTDLQTCCKQVLLSFVKKSDPGYTHWLTKIALFITTHPFSQNYTITW